MPKRLELYFRAAVFCLLAISCGCSSTKSAKPEEEAKELAAKSSASLDAPEHVLFEDAKRQYSNRLFSVAVETWEALRDGYPLGAYREYAAIKAADSRFEMREYEAAALLYEEFVKSHPVSSAVPYALLKAGRSRQLSQRGLGRDSNSLNKAAEAYQTLLQRHSDSVYAEAARIFKTEAEQNLAAHEKMVIDFYKKKDKTAAVEARRMQFKERWGKESADFEVVPVKSSYVETAKEPEENLPAVHAWPLAEFEPPGFDAGSAVMHEVAEAYPPDSQLSSGSAAKYLIRGIECKAEQKLLSIFTGSLYRDRKFLEQHRRIDFDSGVLRLQVSGLLTPNQEELKHDCFGHKDLSISADGVLDWAVSGSSAQLVDLDNPPRLLILIR